MRFTCLACAARFTDWCAEAEPLPRAFCVNCGRPSVIATPPTARRRTRSLGLGENDSNDSTSVPFGLDGSAGDSALGRVIVGDRWFPKTLRGLKAAEALEPTPRMPEVAPDSARDIELATESTRPSHLGEERPASWRRPSYDLQLETLARLSELTADDENTPSSAPAEHAQSEQEPPPSGAGEEPSAGAQRVLSARFARAGSTAPGPRSTAVRAARGRFRRFATGPVPTLLAGFALGMVTMLGVDHARARLGRSRVRVAPSASLAARTPRADGHLGLPSSLAQRSPATRAGGEPTLSAVPAAPTASSLRAQPSRAKPDRAALFAFAHEQQRRLRLEDAQRIYEGVLRVRPADAEALCGLAELALLRGDSNRAEALYERALQLHGDYAPAWLGSADIAWQRGDQARAARLYQAVTARFPEGAYPPYAEQRAQEPTAPADAPQARPRCDK